VFFIGGICRKEPPTPYKWPNMGNAKYEKWHKEAGLCVKCPEPATHGVSCRKHWLAKKVRDRRSREKMRVILIAQGLCGQCRAPLEPEVDEDTKCCQNCREHVGRVNERRGNYK